MSNYQVYCQARFASQALNHGWSWLQVGISPAVMVMARFLLVDFPIDRFVFQVSQWHSVSKGTADRWCLGQASRAYLRNDAMAMAGFIGCFIVVEWLSYQTDDLVNITIVIGHNHYYSYWISLLVVGQPCQTVFLLMLRLTTLGYGRWNWRRITAHRPSANSGSFESQVETYKSCDEFQLLLMITRRFKQWLLMISADQSGFVMSFVSLMGRKWSQLLVSALISVSGAVEIEVWVGTGCVSMFWDLGSHSYPRATNAFPTWNCSLLRWLSGPPILWNSRVYLNNSTIVN